jgi:hypothetical protein
MDNIVFLFPERINVAFSVPTSVTKCGGFKNGGVERPEK